MTDALWQQVRAAPHDAGVIAVLADALIEAGDPQGELMSVQLDLESSRGHELVALRAREAELLASLRERLLGGLPNGEYAIRRGLVMGAKLGHGFNERVPLARRTFLDELWLRVNFDPREVVDHPAVWGVKKLVFGIPKNVAGVALGMPHLEDLRVLAAGDATCDLIAANPSVKHVTLDRVRLDGYASLAKILPQLVTLKLRTWILPEVMQHFVAGDIDHLEVLRIPGHETGRFVPALVTRDFPKLRELDLRGVALEGATMTRDPMTDDGMLALAASHLRPKKLAVGVSAVSGTGVETLLRSPLAAELEELIVEGVPLVERGVKMISELPELRRLQLLECALDADDATILASPRWTLLDLSRNNISEPTRDELVAILGGDVIFDARNEWIERT